MTFSALGGGMGGGGGRRSHSLGDFLAAQKAFVCLKKAPKQTLCSLPTSEMQYIASNSMFKTSWRGGEAKMKSGHTFLRFFFLEPFPNTCCQGFGHLVAAFTDQNVTQDMLPELSDNNLKELRLNIGWRLRFRGAVSTLTQDNQDPTVHQ